jgi:hypothetical protein
MFLACSLVWLTTAAVFADGDSGIAPDSDEAATSATSAPDEVAVDAPEADAPQPTPTSRLVGVAAVVDPFATPEPSAVAEASAPLTVQPQQPLPPGPANRLP